MKRPAAADTDRSKTADSDRGKKQRNAAADTDRDKTADSDRGKKPSPKHMFCPIIASNTEAPPTFEAVAPSPKHVSCPIIASSTEAPPTFEAVAPSTKIYDPHWKKLDAYLNNEIDGSFLYNRFVITNG